MNSMTGFGKAEYKNGYELCVEIKTVNNRFLDVLPKYPKSFAAFDDAIRKTVQSKLTRGRVEIFFTFSDMRGGDKQIGVDLPLAKAYYEAAQKISEHLGIENDLTVLAIMRSPDVISSLDNETDEEELKKIVISVLSDALDNLNVMRKVEGEKLKNDMLCRISEVERLVKSIEALAPAVQDSYRARLSEKVSNALGGADIDESRIIQEVAIFADKADINEEITRLHSHISQFRKIAEGLDPGRKLDFLIQEFNREANTICSKSNDIQITGEALSLKSEIEKIREQVQNVE